MSVTTPAHEAARAAVVELFRAEADWRRIFGRACRASAARLRAIAPQVADELAELGQRFTVVQVENALLALAREKVPDSPAAQWDAEHASSLCKDALARLGEHFAGLSEAERDRLDLSGQEPHEDAMLAVGHANDPAAFRVALREWERVGLEALERARSRSGAA